MILVILLRYIHALALAVWLGGMLVTGALVAPATFDVLQGRDPLAGRVAAGAVFGEVLRRLHLVAYAAGGTLIVTLVGMALVGPRPSSFSLRLAIAGAMLAVALTSGVAVSGRIASLQHQIAGPVSALQDGDPRRGAFGRLHAISTALMVVNVVGGLALLYWEAARD
jgi:putative copper export protein